MHDYKAPKKTVSGSKKKFTKEQIFKMNKEEQIKFLKGYGVKSIPATEFLRVEKILELQ